MLKFLDNLRDRLRGKTNPEDKADIPLKDVQPSSYKSTSAEDTLANVEKFSKNLTEEYKKVQNEALADLAEHNATR